MPLTRTVCMIGHPAAGHIHPTLPVIAELVRAGERVLYWATEPFRARIEATGAEFRSLGEQEWFERGLANGGTHAGMLGGMDGLYTTTKEILEPLAAQVRAERPDYLLVEAHAVWGNLLQQMLGVPAVTLCSMFALNDRLISPLALLGHLYGGATTRGVFEGMIGLSRYFETARRLDARHGTRSPGILGYLGNPQPRNIVFTSREFQVGREAFDSRYLFVGPTAEAAPSAPFDHLPPGDAPLVYISMGTMYNNEPALYRACMDAFPPDRWRAVLSVGRRIGLPSLPPAPAHFAVHAEVPQMAVLRQAALFVTHGGINSAHEAMLAGVPMILLPCAADHFVVASQVAAAGAGIVLNRSEATAERLASLAAQVLSDPRYRARSHEMGDSLRAAGGAPRAAAEILAFAPQTDLHQ